MTEAIVERASAIIELRILADDFAARAQSQETFRDRVRPGSGVHHHHAHSATLWRLAEGSLRARIHELESDSAM